MKTRKILLWLLIPLALMQMALSCEKTTKPSNDGNEKILKVETGKASYYADKFHGRPTASGEKYDKRALTAAHKKLPFQSIVRVINLKNGKKVIVKVNDRGPFVAGRIIDLSRAAADEIEMVNDGVVNVRIEVLRMGPGGS